MASDRIFNDCWVDHHEIMRHYYRLPVGSFIYECSACILTLNKKTVRFVDPITK